MSTTSKKERHDAHDELAPLARLLAPFLVPLVAREIVRLGAVAPTERPYASRPAGQLPPGSTLGKFHKVGRERRKAGDPECWCEGRTVLMTPSAWLRGLEALGQGRTTPKAPVSEARPVDPDARALELLGLAPRRTA